MQITFEAGGFYVNVSTHGYFIVGSKTVPWGQV